MVCFRTYHDVRLQPHCMGDSCALCAVDEFIVIHARNRVIQQRHHRAACVHQGQCIFYCRLIVHLGLRIIKIVPPVRIRRIVDAGAENCHLVIIFDIVKYVRIRACHRQLAANHIRLPGGNQICAQIKTFGGVGRMTCYPNDVLVHRHGGGRRLPCRTKGRDRHKHACDHGQRYDHRQYFSF